MAATRSPAASSPAAAEETPERLELIEELTTNVDAAQERVLADILGRNAESEYLVKCGLGGGGAVDRAAFRAKVPMVTYEDLKPYILRIANGDRSPVLTGSRHPVTEFFISSGTSGGEPKLIPTVEDDADRLWLVHSLLPLLMPDSMRPPPPVGGNGKNNVLHFVFVRSETTTPGGLPARSFITSRCKSEHFKNLVRRAFTSPVAAILCPDVSQSMYAQVVCGLCLRHDVVCVRAGFASTLVRVVHFLRQHCERLAADIEAGELDPASVSDASVREAVAAGVLRRPDPELARFVRAECSKPDWGGIIARVWPNARYLETIATGSMAQYVPALNHYSGGLPIVSSTYVSSECFMGINLRPLCDPSEVSYTFLPSMAYFEFLPNTDAGTDDATGSDLVELAAVEPGREYEVVVTTYAGLCRYHVGDVLRVTGFHNAAPQFRVVGRRNVLLSIDSDKTGEAELQHAVARASAALLQPLGAAVLDFTSMVACTTETVPGHYVLYWELMALSTTTRGAGDDLTTLVDGGGGVLERCCLEVEEALSYVYRALRVDGSIGPLEIRVVRPGTFEELADFAASRGGASVGQYKVPRCVSAAPAIVQLLDARVVSCHFSPALPQWAPGPALSSLNRALRLQLHASTRTDI